MPFSPFPEASQLIREPFSSFAPIGIIWVNHHPLFKNFSDVDRTLLFINLPLGIGNLVYIGPAEYIAPAQPNSSTRRRQN